MNKTKIFLDSGNPQETAKIQNKLGSLDGQTTNPSLVAKQLTNNSLETSQASFSENEIWEKYNEIINNIAYVMPNGVISIEVFADSDTSAENMITQAEKLSKWTKNAFIKLPVTQQGLKAAQILSQQGIKLNMTLVFSQEQAAAVYSATKGAPTGSVFVSPFIGRLDDIGQNGLDLIKNILKMYKSGDGHVEVLSASIRGMQHFKGVLELESDIVTAPYKILNQWAEEKNVTHNSKQGIGGEVKLAEILYKELDLNNDWKSFNIAHELTTKGINKFVSDWKQLFAPK